VALATIEITPESWAAIERIGRAAAGWMGAVAGALGVACGIGGDQIAEWMQMGELGLRPGNAGQGGLASGVAGWMLSQTEPLGAIGVPGNHPAAAYAGIQETGGTIYPKNAKALAVPVSAEAKLHESPREMDGLVLIKRPGKPPILARVTGDKVETHWVLVASVTLQATHWLSTGVERAAPEMARVMLMELQQFLSHAA
jgi:hypothetical protein